MCPEAAEPLGVLETELRDRIGRLLERAFGELVASGRKGPWVGMGWFAKAFSQSRVLIAVFLPVVGGKLAWLCMQLGLRAVSTSLAEL